MDLARSASHLLNSENQELENQLDRDGKSLFSEANHSEANLLFDAPSDDLEEWNKQNINNWSNNGRIGNKKLCFYCVLASVIVIIIAVAIFGFHKSNNRQKNYEGCNQYGSSPTEFKLVLHPSTSIYNNNTATSNYTLQKLPSEYRLLNWNDFTGIVPTNCDYYAATYNYLHFWQLYPTTDFSSINIIMEVGLLNNSFVKREHISDGLLKHEQGHFNIAIIYSYECLKLFHQIPYKQPDYLNYTQTAFATWRKCYDAYRNTQTLYDQETDHGADKQSQSQWNYNLDQQISKLNNTENIS